MNTRMRPIINELRPRTHDIGAAGRITFENNQPRIKMSHIPEKFKSEARTKKSSGIKFKSKKAKGESSVDPSFMNNKIFEKALIYQALEGTRPNAELQKNISPKDLLVDFDRKHLKSSETLAAQTSQHQNPFDSLARTCQSVEDSRDEVDEYGRSVRLRRHTPTDFDSNEIHYDYRSEKRRRGVGAYEFSQLESVRTSQLQDLREMHRETANIRKNKSENGGTYVKNEDN